MLIWQKWIKRSDLRANRDALYLFGDNLARRGRGGQAAEMRGEPNALGIATKYAPGLNAGDFFSDASYESNVESLKLDLRPAIAHAERGGIVICPADGLGTGLSDLPRRAPQTFAALELMLKHLAKITPTRNCTCTFDGGMAR